MSVTSAPLSALDIDVASLSLEELWMPFTANRAFKRAPRLLVEAKGMYYIAADGRRILDGTAGLWCVNAGHCREPIAHAIAEQAARLDYAPGFQMGHPLEFELGQPEHGRELANELEVLVQRYGASTIAAVIIEPVAGSTGVLIPPKGYLERLREICTRHGILLIFDEVITGFGRLGAPFAADYFGVQPDLMTVAKGITNASVPMGAVFVRRGIYETVVNATEQGIEFFHGYTYSGHPLACAAALATLGLYREEGLFERAASLAPYFEDAVHSLRGAPHVVDVRSLGIVAGIELESRPAKGARAFEAFTRCFSDENVLIRTTGDIIALSPPLIVEKEQIDEIVGSIKSVLERVD